MKFTAAATLLSFAAATSAAPTGAVSKRQTSGLDVIGSVNSWMTDVVNVNSFLDMAASLSPSDLATMATTTMGFAADEPTQLGLLMALPGLSADGTTAAQDLMMVFQVGVLNQLQIIIDNSNDATMVANAVATINDTRCLRVLPDVDILWPAAFTAVSIGPLPGPAQREMACEAINGTK